MMGWRSKCYVPSLRSTVFQFSNRIFLKGFYHICEWRLSWSCDLDPVKRLVSEEKIAGKMWTGGRSNEFKER